MAQLTGTVAPTAGHGGKSDPDYSIGMYSFSGIKKLQKIEVEQLNGKAINFIKNFSYTLTSNFISTLVSILAVIIIPKLIGVEEYGYWQLYLFYSSYVGFLHFGWNDGIYLRYGGNEYEELNKRLFFSQFYMLAVLQVMLAIIIFVISALFIVDVNRIFIIQMTALCMLLMNTSCMLLFILQSTNRIKEYARITILGRIVYSFLIIILLVFGVKEYRLIIAADLICKLISLLFAMYCCKDIVFRKLSTFYFCFRETMENISVGIKLMFANIASMLIIGVVRFGIERSWDVSVFGKVALTLGVSNLMMIFINAVGIIIFPILRRTHKTKLSSIYVTMRDFLMVLLLGALIVYYPIKFFLSEWLPAYADSLMYMALIFPICIYEGKMALLINTYLKALRQEKLMLKINLISLFLSFMVTFVTTLLLKNLDLAIASIVVVLVFRCVLAEILLSKTLCISKYKDIILELMMTLIFISTGWFINSWLTVVLYSLAYTMYLIVKRKDLANTLKNIKLLIKS